MVLTARSLRIDADLGALAEVRGFIRLAAAEAEAPVSCLEDLVQAVDEAATNTIVHGYDGAPGWLEVSAEMDGPSFVVHLEDAGHRLLLQPLPRVAGIDPGSTRELAGGRGSILA